LLETAGRAAVFVAVVIVAVAATDWAERFRRSTTA